MNKKFSGVYTAVITPFHEDESIDWDSFERLVEFQISAGVAGIVPCGTTGESPTLSHREHNELVAKTVELVAGRCQVIAGTGSNSTREAIEMTRHAAEAGVDACMVVNPYYNKPTQEGLYRHFCAVADSVETPIVIYNIQGRTGVNVETTTLLRILEDCRNVLAVKEASGNINQIREVIAKSPEYFSVLSGDDGITLDLIEAGGQGVISVASNVIPDRMCLLVQAALNNELENARQINADLAEFFRAEFLETNPIPIKAAVAAQGRCKEVYRLPMCEMSESPKAEWMQILRSLKVLD